MTGPLEVAGHQGAITHTDKIIFDRRGDTKLDLINATIT